jgi:hypothetical protein
MSTASEENDLRGPALSRIDYVQGAPDWWIRGAQIRRVSDGQKARAAYSQDGRLIACLERGIAGVFKVEAQAQDWESDDEPVNLTAMDLARVSYAADQALLTSLGVSGVPKWDEMREDVRIAWMSSCRDRAPLEGDFGPLRTNLRLSILKALRVNRG